MTDTLSTTEVAARLGVTVGRVRHLVAAGVLHTEPQRPGWRGLAILAASVDAYLAEKHDGMGRKPNDAPLAERVARRMKGGTE